MRGANIVYKRWSSHIDWENSRTSVPPLHRGAKILWDLDVPCLMIWRGMRVFFCARPSGFLFTTPTSLATTGSQRKQLISTFNLYSSGDSDHIKPTVVLSSLHRINKINSYVPIVAELGLNPRGGQCYSNHSNASSLVSTFAHNFD